jgi:ABC-type branched-subunit amino acid transport system ATPase component/predicted MFS family arabinose efflux permease
MSRRRRDEEPRPIAGAQIDTDEADKAAESEAPEQWNFRRGDDFEQPKADAPTVVTESYIPGTKEAANARADLNVQGNLLVRTLKLMREGIRPSNLRSSYGKKPLIVIMGLGIVGTFAAEAYGLALPDIQRDLKTNVSGLLAASSYIGLLTTALAIPFGYMADRRRRVTMYGVGNAIASAGIITAGLSNSAPQLIGSRLLTGLGSEGPSSAGFGLIADYVPPEYRGQAFAFRNVAYSVAGIIAPLLIGIVGTFYGWRLPFLIAGGLSVLLSLYFLTMPEPIRGYHERKAFGANEEVSRRAQEPPSMGEAFRAAWGVRTLRRTCYAIPFSTIASRGLGFIYGLYLARVHGVTILGRGIAGAVGAIAVLLGLMIGGPLTDRFLSKSPGRVVMINGVAGIVNSLSYIAIALAPNFLFAIVLGTILAFANSVIEPATVAVTSVVIPPRLRGLGIATTQVWSLPAYFAFGLLIGPALSHGVRWGLIYFVPWGIISSIIYMTAGPFVEFDIRAATAAAIASEEWRVAKEEGRGKLLVMRSVDVHYDAVQVLFGVDLDVQEGELVALLGTNGAGKSTLLRAISGTQEASGGAIVLDGRDITHVPPHEIAKHGAAQTPGGRGIFPGLSVRENLQLAGWLYGQDPKHAEELEQIFTYFPILRERLDQIAGSLSGGEQQMLTLSQAFLARPKLLMIDELSLGLAPQIVEQLLGIVSAIHERGTTIIIVEQSVNVALTVAKRAVFMEKGEVRFDGPTEELLGRPDIMRAVFLKGGRTLSVGATATDRVKIREGERANILEVHNLVKRYGGVAAVNDVSFALREGETLGFIGPNGAGKTTVLEIISGFNSPDSGAVVFDGRDITNLEPDERAKIGLIRRFQDAKLFPSLTVAETISIAFERQIEVRSMIVQGLGLPQARQSELRIRKKVDILIELLGLEAYQDKFISEVSTGTRRVIDLACVLAAEPRVLLLDEPSSGLAQREAENMAPLLNQVKRETGCALIIIEHDMPLISAVSDELVAMVLGEVVARGEPDEVLSNERVVQAYLGTTEEVIQRSGRVKGK